MNGQHQPSLSNRWHALLLSFNMRLESMLAQYNPKLFNWAYLESAPHEIDFLFMKYVFFILSNIVFICFMNCVIFKKFNFYFSHIVWIIYFQVSYFLNLFMNYVIFICLFIYSTMFHLQYKSVKNRCDVDVSLQCSIVRSVMWLMVGVGVKGHCPCDVWYNFSPV